MSDTLYIIDTFSLVFNVFHAIRQPMTGSRGQPTNAVFGFVGDLEHIIKEKKPTHLICAMESQEPQVRVEMYTEYKAHREEMPDDLRPQISMILDVISAYGIPVISCPGWEADDVIATLARQADEAGMDVRIVTSDKDARQLITPKVKIYSIRKRQFYDEIELMKDWGVRPDQVIDFQALVGDSVDNVPGVPQVGPKTATQLLQQFGTLDAVLATPEAAQVKSKTVLANLKTFAGQARLSKKLVTLQTDLPIECDWEQARVTEPHWDKMLALFNDFGFRRYANEAQIKVNATKIVAPQHHRRTWQTIRTPGAFETFLKELEQQSSFCLDLETTNQDPLRAAIVGWAFCWQADVGYYIPVDGPPKEQMIAAEEVAKRLKPILEGSPALVNQNIKYDLLVLRTHGINPPNIGVDPMVGDYLLDAGAREHNLDALSKKWLLRSTIPISDLIGSGKRQLKMFEVDVEEVAEYASEDADVAWQIAGMIEQKLKQENLWDLYWKLERPLISVLADMEFNGIRVDTAELKRQSNAAAIRLDALIKELYQIAGREFNVQSPKQLAEILFNELKLPVVKRTKTGPSTDEEVLEELSSQHPLPAKIMEHRMLAKLKGAYLDALPSLVNPTTGKLHTSFSQTTAATGRLSSKDPNLQNIPIRTEEGKLVRQAFIASQPGWKIVSADYSQIELRVLAHFSQDPALLAAFREGIDIHRKVAAEVFGVPPELVDANQRSLAKAVNFGVIYGQTAYGLSATLDIDKSAAEGFIADYFQKYPGVETFINNTLVECRRTGYATTIMGRRREVDGIRPKRFRNLNMPERIAVNTVIQGSAADLIKQAMLNIHDRLLFEQSSAKMLLQIHDELIFECPDSEVEQLTEFVREEMSSALPLSVPLVVDVGSGNNWLDAK